MALSEEEQNTLKAYFENRGSVKRDHQPTELSSLSEVMANASEKFPEEFVTRIKRLRRSLEKHLIEHPKTKIKWSKEDNGEGIKTVYGLNIPVSIGRIKLRLIRSGLNEGQVNSRLVLSNPTSDDSINEIRIIIKNSDTLEIRDGICVDHNFRTVQTQFILSNDIWDEEQSKTLNQIESLLYPCINIYRKPKLLRI